MHEFSLVQNLMTELARLAEEHQAGEIIKVRVEIGPLAGVVIDSFTFAFSALSQDQPLTRAAKLEISSPEASYHCLDCGEETGPAPQRPQKCANCQGRQLMAQGGDELLLTQVEME
ncbi:MAG: hydrogenase maturation nickel metallochaperone HypA [Thermodesulfobacteriota bacterium]